MSDIDKKVSWKHLDKNKCVYTNTDADTASNNCYYKAEDILQKLRDRKLKNCGEEAFDKCVIHFPEIYPSAKLVVDIPDNELIEIGNDPYFATCFDGAISDDERNDIYDNDFKLTDEDKESLIKSIKFTNKKLHPNAIISGKQSPVTKNNEGKPVPYYSFIRADTYVTYVENTVRQDIKDALKKGVNELAEKAALINLTCEVGNAEITLSCYDDDADDGEPYHYVKPKESEPTSSIITKAANEQVKSVPYSYNDSIFDKDYYSIYTIFDGEYKTFNNISEDDFVTEEEKVKLEYPAFEIKEGELKEGVKIYFNYVENSNAANDTDYSSYIDITITKDQKHFGEIFDDTETSITIYPNRLLDTYLLFETGGGNLYAFDFDIINRLKDISTNDEKDISIDDDSETTLKKSDLYYFTNAGEYPKYCLSFKAKVEINEQVYNQALSELKCNYQNLEGTLDCPINDPKFDNNTQVQITAYDCIKETYTYSDNYKYGSTKEDESTDAYEATLVLLPKKDEEGNEITHVVTVITGEYTETISGRDLGIDTISFLNTNDEVSETQTVQEYTQSKIQGVFGNDTQGIKKELVDYTNNTLMSKLQCQYGNPNLSATCKGNAKINCDGNTRELALGTYSEYLDVESVDTADLTDAAIKLQQELTKSAAKEITDKLCLECKIANIEINMFCDKASAEGEYDKVSDKDKAKAKLVSLTPPTLDESIEITTTYMPEGVKYINLSNEAPDPVETYYMGEKTIPTYVLTQALTDEITNNSYYSAYDISSSGFPTDEDSYDTYMDLSDEEKADIAQTTWQDIRYTLAGTEADTFTYYYITNDQPETEEEANNAHCYFYEVEQRVKEGSSNGANTPDASTLDTTPEYEYTITKLEKEYTGSEVYTRGEDTIEYERIDVSLSYPSSLSAYNAAYNDTRKYGDDEKTYLQVLAENLNIAFSEEETVTEKYAYYFKETVQTDSAKNVFYKIGVTKDTSDKPQELKCLQVDLTSTEDLDLIDFPVTRTAYTKANKTYLANALKDFYNPKEYPAIQQDTENNSYYYYFKSTSDTTYKITSNGNNETNLESAALTEFPTDFNNLKIFIETISSSKAEKITASFDYLFSDIYKDDKDEQTYYIAIIPSGYDFKNKTFEQILNDLNTVYSLADGEKNIEELYLYKNNYIGSEYDEKNKDERYALDEMGQTKETIPSCVYFESAETNSSEAQAYLKANKYAIDQAILSVYCMYGNIDLPAITCDDKLGKNLWQQQIGGDAIKANTYVGLTPNDADTTAYNARSASLFCLAVDWAGGGGSSVSVKVEQPSCSGCTETCCIMF